jgi:hypothetical protein
VSITHLCENGDFVGFLKGSKYQIVVKFAKQMGLGVLKRGNNELTKAMFGTWIHR